MRYSRSSYGGTPHQPGVYRFLDENGEILYVGKAKDLKNRVSSYFVNTNSLYGKTRVLVSLVKTIEVTIVDSEIEALLLEAALVKKYSPKYNIRLTDGKAYPLIRVVRQKEYSCVLTARRREDPKSVYFGPFPSSSSVRMVLRTIRRIFPYQSVKNHPKRICLYHHLGLCPCVPYLIGSLHEYEKTIRHIIDFLDGKTKKVIKELENERNELAKTEHFEKAAAIQKQLDAIAYITQPITKPFDYETNPQLREDTREKEMHSLQEILQQHGTNIAFPRRIECYDNSNFQGTNPTSSMVVLTNGEIDKSQYRKFKIRKVQGANDFATMQEVLQRRFKHPEWPMPDLLVVDGGKGQVSAAMKALGKHLMLDTRSKKLDNETGSLKVDNLSSNIKHQDLASSFQSPASIPIIGLAKREETIITSDLQEIHLPKSSPALQLMVRIRNEAHRFAISYHRKLRGKATFE